MSRKVSAAGPPEREARRTTKSRQTIAQRKKLATALPSERHFDYADGYRDGWDAATSKAVKNIDARWTKIKFPPFVWDQPIPQPEPKAEGQAEALPERSEARLKSFWHRIKSYIA